MLVLSRKVGEKIVIGNNVTIVVQRVGKGRVALAIDAPQNITVLRGELAPFGLEDAQIEFIDGDAEEEEHEETGAGSETAGTNILAHRNARASGSNRLRAEVSTRTGFPPLTPELNPTSEVSSTRSAHAFPSR